ncbi:MAG TPA: AMP-binding protein, partial [Longimicrobium sp.]|nr:AMP-binding protein [Longimicrobium sp.]
MSAAEPTLDSLLTEDRTFPPPPAFAAQALVRDAEVYARAAQDPEAYWAQWASELHWFRRWDRVLEWEPPYSKWFVGGTLNASYNCLDRHVEAGRGSKTAMLWEGEPGDKRTFTYAELHAEVGRAANALRKLGVKKGDRVAIYLPMIPEAAIAMLACARIGAAHSVVFGGFSAESLRDRIRDAEARVLITADGGYRRGGIVALKRAADEAVDQEGGCPTIQHVVVVRRHGMDGEILGDA